MSDNIDKNATNAEGNDNAENNKEAENNTTNETNATENNVAEDTSADAIENDTPIDEAVTDKLLDEMNELKDKYLRLNAEFENYKRRTAKERLELSLTANKETIVSLLDVLDDVDRAEEQINKSDDVVVIKEGISLVFDKVRKVLQAKGLKEMDGVKENEFDVALHEAITELPVPGMEGKVIDVVQKGYYLNSSLLRFAKVVVGKQTEA
jgi:molecular chaperone GrpE